MGLLGRSTLYCRPVRWLADWWPRGQGDHRTPDTQDLAYSRGRRITHVIQSHHVCGSHGPLWERQTGCPVRIGGMFLQNIMSRLILHISRYPIVILSRPRDTQLQNTTERLDASQQKLLPTDEVIESLVLRAGSHQFQRAAAKKTLLKDAGSVSQAHSIIFLPIESCCLPLGRCACSETCLRSSHPYQRQRRPSSFLLPGCPWFCARAARGGRCLDR